MAEKPSAPKRMLVIDDESVVLSSCRRIFTPQGFEVVTTESPRQGLELAAGSKFDIILCDWRMPEIDGMDVVEMLDKRSPDSAVVMITGFPAVDRATEVMKRGAMDYVAKPFTPEEISAGVERAMKRKETEEKQATDRPVLSPCPAWTTRRPRPSPRPWPRRSGWARPPPPGCPCWCWPCWPGPTSASGPCWPPRPPSIWPRSWDWASPAS